jgi:conjugal transfer pilus assembly protein TraV
MGLRTFGSNEGEFLLPCAGRHLPSSSIDDRALAITGDARTPCRHRPASVRPGSRHPPSHGASPARAGVDRGAPHREKVLRIVFQPYIDERGRLARGERCPCRGAIRVEWQQQASRMRLPSPTAGRLPHLFS